MPQIWLTDEELAMEFRCEADEARAISIARGWTRKRSRDGVSRALLPTDMVRAFMASAVLEGDATEAMVAELRATSERMRRPASRIGSRAA